MNQADQEVESTRKWVVDEHRRLLGTIRGVETIVEAPGAATGDIARRLEELATLWETHAREEEASALYTDYPKQYPHLADELGALEKQHVPLTEELRRLADECHGCDGLTLDSPISIRIRSTVAQLRQHEAHEAALMQRLQSAEDTPPSTS